MSLWKSLYGNFPHAKIDMPISKSWVPFPTLKLSFHFKKVQKSTTSFFKLCLQISKSFSWSKISPPVFPKRKQTQFCCDLEFRSLEFRNLQRRLEDQSQTKTFSDLLSPTFHKKRSDQMSEKIGGLLAYFSVKGNAYVFIFELLFWSLAFSAF